MYILFHCVCWSEYTTGVLLGVVKSVVLIAFPHGLRGVEDMEKHHVWISQREDCIISKAQASHFALQGLSLFLPPSKCLSHMRHIRVIEEQWYKAWGDVSLSSFSCCPVCILSLSHTQGARNSLTLTLTVIHPPQCRCFIILRITFTPMWLIPFPFFSLNSQTWVEQRDQLAPFKWDQSSVAPCPDIYTMYTN